MDTTTLRRLLDKGKLEPFIRCIRFPQYKNLVPFTQIDFTFPITALVGANGTNKSSLLRALYGSPGNNNLGNFWFSTATDVIEDGDSFPNCFVYAYRHPTLHENVEVLKTRASRAGNPDYWEPSRPIKRYSMAPMPLFTGTDPHREKTRWKTISKNAELVDFRHALSAFDKYFYFGSFTRTVNFRTKQDFIRHRAPHLNNVLDNRKKSYKFYKKERIVNGESRTLRADELHAVCSILGRDYSEICVVHHTFFKEAGYTAKLKQSHLSYTEAFAGSGEFAAIRLVIAILNAPERSLILLDEPEVSLHPGAQEKLLELIAEQVVKKKHQVVFTTHSPALIRHLPPDAIKVLALGGVRSEVFLTSQSSLPEEAFLKIGEPIPGLKLILVEDPLAAEIVKKCLRDHEPGLLPLVDLRFFPGGSSVLFGHYLASYAAENRNNVLCILDGDQAPGDSWPTQAEIRKLDDAEVADRVKTQAGSEIVFQINSGTEEAKSAQRAQMGRQYLGWCKRYVQYLPGSGSPEAFILEKTGKDNGTDPKDQLKALTHQELDLLPDESPSADDIFGTQRRLLSAVNKDDSDLKALSQAIVRFLQGQPDD